MLKKKFFKTKDECEVTFEVALPEANEVVLIGEFNDWAPIQMKKAKAKNAPFRVKVRIPKDGKFQFRYFVNAQAWHNDDAADAYCSNEHGSDNSVVSTFSEN
ncbi:MAG: 1,4-alpha-glucan branching protein [Chloroflexi bacterium]|nr:1,4-alpha-glucan branching protein [Chloroflexota bacterium]